MDRRPEIKRDKSE